MKKAAKAIAFVLMFALMFSFAACNTVQTGTAATVNGEEIPVAEIQYMMNVYGAQATQNATGDVGDDYWNADEGGQTRIEIVRENAINYVTQQYLIRQKMKELGMTLTDEDLQTITDQKAKDVQSLGGQDAYKNQLKQLGLSEEQYSDMLERSVYVSKYQTYLSENDERFKDPTDEDIQKYAETEYVKAKHILFKTTDDSNLPLAEDAIAQKKQLAEDTLGRIKNGEDFDTLMNELSEDPGSKQEPEGYFFTKNQMVKPFETAAFALKDGEVSDLVESDFGYHIIKRVPVDYAAELTDEVKQTISSNILNGHYETLIKEMEAAATITKNEDVINKLKVQKLPQASSSGSNAQSGSQGTATPTPQVQATDNPDPQTQQ